MTLQPYVHDVANRFVDTPAQDHLVRLASRPIPPPLTPKRAWDISIATSLKTMPIEELFTGREVVDADAARCVKAGLLLWADALNAAHEIVQEVTTPTGSYWHAIMHRREPDWANSKYWFRKVGEHPIFPELRAGTLDLLKLAADTNCKVFWGFLHGREDWDPYHFVDCCEQVTSSGSAPEFETHLEQIQTLEIVLLISYSYREAVGED